MAKRMKETKSRRDPLTGMPSWVGLPRPGNHYFMYIKPISDWCRFRATPLNLAHTWRPKRDHGILVASDFAAAVASAAEAIRMHVRYCT